jgi:prepilin-type N-terminal cleavage/methylation domain-containing protein
VSRGFTLLEVLVAMTILALALVAMVQLSAQGLRLLRLSEDYQGAVRLADHLARVVEPEGERVETGQQGLLRWERRTTLVSVPEGLTAASGPRPLLYAVSVAVGWGPKRTLELTSLRTVVEPSDGSEVSTTRRSRR